ncbi:MAG: hypothetical protein H7287_08610 [Thermoleophilia bacterium]|nr:hypothetical protein [Thermoleophilia bacterium]
MSRRTSAPTATDDATDRSPVGELVGIADVERRMSRAACGFDPRVSDQDKLRLVPQILIRLEGSMTMGGGFILATLTCTRSEAGLSVVSGAREYAVVRDMVHRATLRGDDWWARHILQMVHFRLVVVDASQLASRELASKLGDASGETASRRRWARLMRGALRAAGS